MANDHYVIWHQASSMEEMSESDLAGDVIHA
jgi:hypothetical protein